MRKRVTCCNDESGATTGGAKAKRVDFPDVQLDSTRSFGLDFSIASAVSVEYVKEVEGFLNFRFVYNSPTTPNIYPSRRIGREKDTSLRQS
ncbi:hypothetical protein NPIL_81811 [Nephila pilipes]|uniref:Uncharacterized protein n=1 Tax=Nephila pilipes TaxID=299642 RepID=A0A8X6UEH8_NEPPI|nr:hypothetical protein NPIL_81811 [Nephila pilipes]